MSAWRDFPADEVAEEAIAGALRESPVGASAPAATLALTGFLQGILLGVLGIVGLHFGVGLLRLVGPARYALEAVLMIAVGVTVLRYWRRLAQEGRAVDAKGQPVSGDTLLSAYRQFVFGPTYRSIGTATGVETSGPGAGPSFDVPVAVGRTVDHLVLSAWEPQTARLRRGGWALARVTAVEAAPGGARVVLPDGGVTLAGLDAAELCAAILPGGGYKDPG